jgi:hypothetical protein
MENAMSKRIALMVNDEFISPDVLDNIPLTQKTKIKDFCLTIIDRIQNHSPDEDILFPDFDSMGNCDRFVSNE